MTNHRVPPKRQSWRRGLPWLIAAVLAVPVAGFAVGENKKPAADGPPPGATYAGASSCTDCHADLATGLARTPHGSSAFSRISDLGCEACHGPSSQHVEDPNNEAFYPKITEWSAQRQTENCQQCHSGSSQFYWDGSKHATRGMTCSSCHAVHSPKSVKAQLNAASVSDQCYTCHKSVRAEVYKTSHHPIREGKMGCSDCHSPHGSPTPKMINAVSVNDQCYACHAEKRGPYLWEHAPVRENCLNCHSPHGSNHLKLQKTSVPYICQQCHANTRHPGTLYDATTLAGEARQSNRIFNRACLDCHGAIHGSNHPSSPYLGH